MEREFTEAEIEEMYQGWRAFYRRHWERECLRTGWPLAAVLEDLEEEEQ